VTVRNTGNSALPTRRYGDADAPTAHEVYERLREEWDALGLLSFTGDGSGGWRADLNQDDIKQIRALLLDAAATIEAYS
jgi:hypothetical protein